MIGITDMQSSNKPATEPMYVIGPVFVFLFIMIIGLAMAVSPLLDPDSNTVLVMVNGPGTNLVGGQLCMGFGPYVDGHYECSVDLPVSWWGNPKVAWGIAILFADLLFFMFVREFVQAMDRKHGR
jgi:hypothetical protein